jgi:hypothetical protein
MMDTSPCLQTRESSLPSVVQNDKDKIFIGSASIPLPRFPGQDAQKALVMEDGGLG